MALPVKSFGVLFRGCKRSDVALIQIRRSYTAQTINKNSIRIGCASGFWGDTAVAAPQLIHHGKLDFLVFDYLSEITMSLLSAAQQKFPDLGYAPDFLQVVMAPFIKDIKNKGVRVISNAGGVNPESCASALGQIAKKAGVDLNIAVVTGDNLMPRKSELAQEGIEEMFSGKTMPKSVTSMTSYLGAGAISRALDLGADVVVTGRCTDSALVLAPLMHSFKWNPNNFDLMATGSLAGHLIECGAQVTGGIFTDWHTVPNWSNIGFPIAECSADGGIVITKPPKTGGLVTPATASEQLVYELGDPGNYILPDVVCDFTQVQIKAIPGKENEAVEVSGARGKPPTSSHKVCATYLDKYRLTAVCLVGGIKAAAKGRKTAEAILNRTRGMFKSLGLADYSKVHLQVLGAEDSYGPHALKGDGPKEGIVWLAVHHEDKKALQILSREIAPAGTGMAPGLCAVVGGRPKASPVLKLFSFLYPKNKFKIDIHMNGELVEEYIPPEVPSDEYGISESSTSAQVAEVSPPTGSHSYRLEDLAYARSGDKGNNCNIGVIARDPRLVPYISRALTALAVDKYMAHVFEDYTGPVDSRVKRYDMPGIHGFNFVLHNSLGGGGIASLRSDPQGKAFGQMLLDFTIDNMPSLEDIMKS